VIKKVVLGTPGAHGATEQMKTLLAKKGRAQLAAVPNPTLLIKNTTKEWQWRWCQRHLRRSLGDGARCLFSCERQVMLPYPLVLFAAM